MQSQKKLMSKLRDMKKRFLPLSMLLITMVLAQASFVANAAGDQGKYNPRTGSKATFSSFMKSIRANQETGLIDPALMIAGQQAAQTTSRDASLVWDYAGPDNYGGLTRAIIYNEDGTVLIGTMGGDIYKTTNGGITFQRVTNVGLTISSMVKDAAGNIYIGTGDGRDDQDLNGLSTLGYETSFVGKGIYKMAAGSTTPELLTATAATTSNDWAFVNELAYTNGKIYAATAGADESHLGGVMMSADGGTTWTKLYDGRFRSVKANNAGDILAADDSKVYLKKAGATEFRAVTDSIDNENDNPKIIAMSPSDANFMYIAYLTYTSSTNAYGTGNIYFTNDGGTTWQIAIAGTTMYSIFNSDANYDGYMIVYPNNPRKLLVGSDNLWLLEDSQGLGVNSYTPEQISEYDTDEFTPIAWNRYIYVHQGIQCIAFNPSDANVFFIGTNGGVYKGEFYSSLYSFKSSNRYFITEDEHTSVTRMMNVGVGGMSPVLGGCLDHGTIYLAESESLNNVTTGATAFPHVTNNAYVSTYFNKDYAGGPCAISTINPNIFFVSGTGNLSTPIYRTETLGDDYDANFEGEDGPVITNSNAFRTPYAFFENYEDANNPVDTIYAPIRTEKHVGDLVYAYSNQCGYPVDYYITAADCTHQDTLGNPCCMPGDTIRGIHDPLSSLYVVGIEGKLYMTRDALIFNKLTDWLLISTLDGIPTAVAISGDGDVAMVGTAEGNLYKVSGLAQAYTAAQASVDSTACVVTFTALTPISTQAVTSISIDPKNSDKVIVTLGNYGNSNYVYISNNGGSSFTAATGLPAVPAYSSLIEKGDETLYIVGTEIGIYISENGTTWTKSGNVSCPVMDLKQAVQKNHDPKVDVLYDEMGNPTYVIYPGVDNEGMIYAATYGAGILSSATYKEGGDLSIDDNEMVENVQLNIYPNPVKDNGNINITLTESAKVSYQIYDLAGRTVANSELGFYGQGEHTLTFNVGDLASGSYIIRVQAGNKSETAKFLVY